MPSPSPLRKSVSDIKSILLRPALTSHYQCWFNPPSVVQNWVKEKSDAGIGVAYDNAFAEGLSLLCSEASLPGSSLATSEIYNDFTGVTERHAYRRIYDDRADFTFYVDYEHNVIKFFENWIGYIVNEQVTNPDGTRNKGTKGLESPNFSYRVRYPDGKGDGTSGYRADIYINKFERDYNRRYTSYRFLQAYPISINSMPVSYDSSSLLKCTVSFTYTRYFITGELLPDQTNQSLNQTTQNLTGSGALIAPISGFNVGGVPTSPANASGNTVISGFTPGGANVNVA